DSKGLFGFSEDYRFLRGIGWQTFKGGAEDRAKDISNTRWVTEANAEVQPEGTLLQALEQSVARIVAVGVTEVAPSGVGPTHPVQAPGARFFQSTFLRLRSTSWSILIWGCGPFRLPEVRVLLLTSFLTAVFDGAMAPSMAGALRRSRICSLSRPMRSVGGMNANSKPALSKMIQYALITLRAADLWGRIRLALVLAEAATILLHTGAT
ncbi:hypothetical protein AGLY_013650, partial [Aphis glycines]